PTPRCNCMAATATPATSPSNGSTGTCASCASMKGPARSSVSSFPAICWPDRRRTMNNPRHNTRDIYPATGTEITAKSWLTEAPMRMLMNNLHPDVAENPHELVVYGGIGRATRTWKDFDLIVGALKKLESDETLLVQSGKPVGVFKTHK